ncbi:MAG: glycerol-3-phosphate dehydrogenase subunit GlpB [Thermodesulfobacteriota bacterium]
MPERETIKADLTIIGNGLAGLGAALYALNRGLSVVQFGSGYPLSLVSGCFDLFSVCPSAGKKEWDNPWEGLKVLRNDHPEHPLARIEEVEIRQAFEEFSVGLGEAGLSYVQDPERNREIITPLGTIKKTFGLPRSMWLGAEALERKAMGRIIEIEGLEGFKAPLIVDRLKPHWKGLSAGRIQFPGFESRPRALAEHLASSLILSANREKLAQRLRREINGAEVMGLPAVLGLFKSSAVMEDLREQIGIPLFEIPTLPPSVPGLRLQETLERKAAEKGTYHLFRHRVGKAEPGKDGGFKVPILHDGETIRTVSSRAVILAGGRFLGGGLQADRKTVREPLFGLPVSQPDSRSGWHRSDFFNRQGHEINRAGLEVDDRFRPFNRQKEPAYETLFAVGSILAHQDWKREKCGSGLALATALGAVKAFLGIKNK